MADALSKRDPLAPTIPLTVKGREFELAFNINTYDLYETAMERLCGPSVGDEGYSFFDAFGRIIKAFEYLQGAATSRHAVLRAAARENGASEEEIQAIQSPSATTQEMMRSLKFISMRNLHAILWAAASEGERLRAKTNGSKRVQFDIEDLGALLDNRSLMDTIGAIMRGQTASSPRPGEVEEPANSDRPLPQIVIDGGDPKLGPSLVPEADLG